MGCAYRFNFIVAAMTKRGLQDDKMPAGERLHLLEKLNGLTDQHFTAEMLALIDPMSDLEFQIYQEAKSLDAPHPKNKDDIRTIHWKASFDILTGPAFKHFVALNPGLAKAFRLYDGQFWPDTAPQSATSPPADPLAAPAADGPQQFRSSNGTASSHETCDRFSYAPERQKYADGSDYRNPINPHTGR
jgi:hypothetical protein